MKTTKRSLTLTAFGAALFSAAFLGLVLRAQPVQAVPPTPIFPGTWAGTVQSDSGATGSVSLNIDSVDGLQFEGLIGVLVPPTPIIPTEPCRGTVSAAGEISFESETDAAHIEAHGQVGINTMSLRYQIDFADGTFDSGSMDLVLGGGDGNPGT
ncbi:MAG TPA: hypothetical protein VG055_05775 [Planctomycetaceae bacterium]|jgi:hypothetical protein|nr:hypothetical protein [Planctomycetaceae bacterium]